VVVVNGGIHFHHFWYGLALVVALGWTGIALSDARIGRVLAIVFGLGAGLIGDEVGLLLTFGDYYSGLTEVFFVGAIGFIIVAMLLSRGRSLIEKDVFDISQGKTDSDRSFHRRILHYLLRGKQLGRGIGRLSPLEYWFSSGA
jgi:hypothetical protein